MNAAAPPFNFQTELETATKKHGFKNFSEYEDVAATISMLMVAIDPQTKAFTDPPTAIRKAIEDVNADQSVSDETKKQALQELNEALKAVQPVQFPSNVELVKKYYDKIAAILG
jgi:ribosome maturation protein Sdo1